MNLPRVTYSNIRADFSGVHDLLDRRIPAFRQEMLGKTCANRIGGQDDSGGARYTAPCPIDRRIMLGEFVAADAAAADRAVRAAKKAFADWSRTTWQERVRLARKLADELEARKWDLGIACLLEVGKSRFEAMGEAEEAIDLVRYYADEMEANAGFARDLRRAFPQEATSDRLRPVGVFAVIAPFNFPLALSVNMIVGALLGGNTVVYKPSPFAGLTGRLLVDAIEAAGFPRGAVNLLCGGAPTGQALADHPGIDGICLHRLACGRHGSAARGRGRALQPAGHRRNGRQEPELCHDVCRPRCCG